MSIDVSDDQISLLSDNSTEKMDSNLIIKNLTTQVDKLRRASML